MKTRSQTRIQKKGAKQKKQQVGPKGAKQKKPQVGPKHATYKVQGGNLVESTQKNIYYEAGDEALYMIVDIHHTGHDFDLLYSRVNDSENAYSFEATWKTSLTVKTGESFMEKLDISGEFNGLKVGVKAGVEFEHKTFTERETLASEERKEGFKVKPHTAMFVYQKVYHFEVHVWFQLDAWNKMWTVGKADGNGVVEVVGTVDIPEDEVFTTGRELRGTGTQRIQPRKRVAQQTNIRNVKDCTMRCRRYFYHEGIGESRNPAMEDFVK
jgi:hypothetical protein